MIIIGDSFACKLIQSQLFACGAFTELNAALKLSNESKRGNIYGMYIQT